MSYRTSLPLHPTEDDSPKKKKSPYAGGYGPLKKQPDFYSPSDLYHESPKGTERRVVDVNVTKAKDKAAKQKKSAIEGKKMKKTQFGWKEIKARGGKVGGSDLMGYDRQHD